MRLPLQAPLNISPLQLSSFFKGMAFPFYSVPVVNAVVFGSYEFYKRFLAGQAQLPNASSHEAYMQGMLSGVFAGFVNCWVVSPIELVKCRLQVQLDSKEALANTNRYKGPLDLVRRIFKTEGIRGFYRGNFATMTREIPCYGGGCLLLFFNVFSSSYLFRTAQFAAYEATKDFFKAKYGEYTFWHKLIAGRLFKKTFSLLPDTS